MKALWMKSILHNGQEMPIGHLAPRTMSCDCTQIGRDLIIRVTFANHCYTEAFDPEKHTRRQILLYDAPTRPRVFCLARYELSQRLPEIIAELPNRRVNQTPERRNFVYVAPLELGSRLYQIYFMLQRARSGDEADLKLTVESAYPADAPPILPKRPNNIRFRVLAYKVLMGQPIRFAAR